MFTDHANVSGTSGIKSRTSRVLNSFSPVVPQYQHVINSFKINAYKCVYITVEDHRLVLKLAVPLPISQVREYSSLIELMQTVLT